MERILRDESAVPSWLSGTWKRLSMRRQSQPPDETTQVRTVQTPTLFGDVRIPANRPVLSGASSLCDLSDAELATLYDQQGFSGITAVDGFLATWHHHIDYQPPDGSKDIGRLERPVDNGRWCAR